MSSIKMYKEVSHQANPDLNLIFESSVLCKLWDDFFKQMFYIYMKNDEPRMVQFFFNSLFCLFETHSRHLNLDYDWELEFIQFYL